MKSGVVLTRKGGNVPQLELAGLSRGLGRRYRRVDSFFYTVQGSPEELYRLAYSRVVGRYWFSFEKPKELGRRVGDLRRYVLRFPSFGVFGEMGRELGWYLDGRVDLKEPSQRIYVYKGRRYYVLSDAKEIRGSDFSWRDAQKRPFFHPSSMNARDARFLVNVSGVRRGETLLDPFCGAGGILIEGALVGAKVVGIDIDERMVKGCLQNLKYFGLEGRVMVEDARDVDEEVDVIVTDPPYGRSSRTPSRDLRSLYLSFFERARSIVRKSMVVVLPFDGDSLLERAGFDIVGKARWYVHSSLTRRVYLCSP